MNGDKKWYRLVFKQIQPIHIGMGGYGVLNDTRIFIPGWTMWGALTKAYNLEKGLKLSENQSMFESISCFYPSFDEKGEDVLFPCYKDGEFYLGDYSEEKFRAKFVDSFTSTSIIPDSRMARDESLHEIDVIFPGVKKEFEEDRKEEHLFWVGVIGLDDHHVPDDIFPKEIFVGGDVRYGLGLMRLTNKKEIELDINWKKSNYIPIEVKNSSGKIELLVEVIGYEGSLLRVTNRVFYYTPGSLIDNDIITKVTIEKGKLEFNSNHAISQTQ